MSMCDGEAVRWIKITWVRLRLRSECNECGKLLPPGERCRRLAGVSGDGDPFRVTQCEFCARVADDIADMGYCNALGDLWAMVERIEAGA